MGLFGGTTNLRDSIERSAMSEAYESHIASLRAEIRNRDLLIDSLRASLERFSERQDSIIQHLTGMNRLSAVGNESAKLTSVPRPSSIQDRLKRAEAAEQSPESAAQRKREYNDRINSLLNPEIELVGANMTKEGTNENLA